MADINYNCNFLTAKSKIEVNLITRLLTILNIKTNLVVGLLVRVYQAASNRKPNK